MTLCDLGFVAFFSARVLCGSVVNHVEEGRILLTFIVHCPSMYLFQISNCFNRFDFNILTSDLHPTVVLTNILDGFAKPPDVYGKEIGDKGSMDEIVSVPQIC